MAMNMTAGQMNYAEPKEMPASPFDNLAASLELLTDARNRVAKVADVIVGPVPPQGESAAKSTIAGQGGLVEQVERAATAIRALSCAIQGDISRIEHRL